MIRELSGTDVLYLVMAMRWTVFLTLLALGGGSVVGLVIAACGASKNPALRYLARGYVGFVQGIPLLVWLFIFYFGLSILGYSLPPWIAAALGFSVYAGAFLGEIWRGALISIPRTQWEAGTAIGLTYLEQLRHVIIPQAVRVAIPPTVGFTVQLIKNTSLAAVIGFVELTREGQLTTAATFQPFAVYLIVAALYFCMCYPLTRYSRALERTRRVAR
ncbi:MAG: amino acid ABC transporter permease [Betaproteobacteria bacterium]|nr:amino acid ABC transporter permease [Betaproteobacteria bacterium]MBK9607972.1 amino acid ABC transporter permease [Betaproteobacteria bacterium]